MYQLKISPFGAFEKYTFVNSISGNQFSVLPTFGARVLDIIFNNISVLDGYRTPEDLKKDKWKKSAFLFPFVNRLRDGSYQWLGKAYHFPINDVQTGNAIHGFGTVHPMEVDEVQVEANFATMTCSYKYAGQYRAYPFPHTFLVKFRIEEPQHFEIEMRFQNESDTAIPIGFGWHPYFQLSEKTDDLQLQLPPCERLEFNKGLLPTGKRSPNQEFTTLSSVGSTHIDACFALPVEAGKMFVHLRGERGTLRYWQETGVGKFNFLQLFSPETRQSLAIEPMTSVANSFNSGEGLIILQPGEMAIAKAGVVFSFENL